MRQFWSRISPYLRWVVVGGTLFFLAKALKDNWKEVAAIRIVGAGWASLAIALGVTLLAHFWSGWVWSLILQEFNYPIKGYWGAQVYLKTNIAKYLPGNFWHFYGRMKAAIDVGVSPATATLSVLLEPMLMTAAALLIALVCALPVEAGLLLSSHWLEFISLPVVLIAVHPWILNLLIRSANRLKGMAVGIGAIDVDDYQMKRYPLVPLLGEIGFLLLRSAGFLLTWLALQPINPSQIFIMMGAFTVAWLLGLVLPGPPGGIGVFEASAIALLGKNFSPGLVFSAVALYRLVSILAEAVGAGLVWFGDRKKGE